MVLIGYSGARGTLIYEKKLLSKISCQSPFKYQLFDLHYEFFQECPFSFTGSLQSCIFFLHLLHSLSAVEECAK
jgi:hypothetical protein